MNTPESKLKEIVEKAGGCYHSSRYDGVQFKCAHCGEVMGYHNINPSPTDLNALMALAEKLGFRTKLVFWAGYCEAVVYTKPMEKNLGLAYEDTPAAALLDALWQAVKEN